MKFVSQFVFHRCGLAAGLVLCGAAAATAQIPTPVIVDTAVPIVINTIRPHKGPQPPKFEGTVINATILQITVRARGNDNAIQTFPLTEEASTKMLEIIDKGGYQYGDKVTVFYDPDSKKAFKVKGKPSKPS
jgi:hypothetical protein